MTIAEVEVVLDDALLRTPAEVGVLRHDRKSASTARSLGIQRREIERLGAVIVRDDG